MIVTEKIEREINLLKLSANQVGMLKALMRNCYCNDPEYGEMENVLSNTRSTEYIASTMTSKGALELIKANMES